MKPPAIEDVEEKWYFPVSEVGFGQLLEPGAVSPRREEMEDPQAKEKGVIFLGR